MRKSSVTLLALLLLLAAPRLTLAEPTSHSMNRAAANPLECLSSAKGRVLTWNGQWGDSAGDAGVQYRILEVSTRYTYPARSQSVALVLSASSPADRPFRKMAISDEQTARNVCAQLRDRISTLLPDTSTQAVPTPLKQTEPEVDASLPFITYSPDGWVLGDTPPGAHLTICQILLHPYLCTKDDREKFSDRLGDVEKVLLSEAE